MKNSILIDVMLGDHYECQVEYPFSLCDLFDYNGELIREINEDRLRKIVETKKPSLKGKDWHVYFVTKSN